MQRYASTLERISGWILIVTLTLLPLVFLPITQDYYDTNKWFVLVAGTACVLMLWAITANLKKSFSLTLSPAVAAFGSLTVASLVSLLVSSTNRSEAVMSPLGPATMACLTLVLAMGNHVIESNGRNTLRWLLFASAGVTGLVAIYQTLGLGAMMLPRAAFLTDPLWTPVGSSIALVAFLAMVLPLAVEEVVRAWREKREVPGLVAGVCGFLVFAGLCTTLYRLIPMLPRVLLPVSTGWAITLEVLKNVPQALFGVGTENFMTAFTAGRGFQMNTTPLWNVRFATSSNFLFHATSVWGIGGAIAILIFLRVLLAPLWAAEGSRKDALPWGLTAARTIGALSLLLAPPNMTILTTLTLLFFLDQESRKISYQWPIPNHARWVEIGILCFTVLSIGVAAWGLVRVYTAELLFYQSLLASQKNNGTQTYNLQLVAIQKAPAISRFHIAFSQTNFALSNSLAFQASQEATAPGIISDQDRQLIATFVQQSIREAKIAVTLAPTNVIAWENLARIYQGLTPVAAGADAWAVATYLRAVQLDPTDPIMRLNLGASYVTQQNYDSAIKQYTFATDLKPDYANAYYNLAFVYRTKGDIPKSIAALEQTLTLVASGSSDWVKAQRELEDLKNKQPSVPQAVGGSLTVPTSAEKLVKPQLVLPTESAPEIASPSPQSEF